ncbi:MAG: lasso peptide biosynthesis B2 protein [Acidimicrobiia bacterium]
MGPPSGGSANVGPHIRRFEALRRLRAFLRLPYSDRRALLAYAAWFPIAALALRLVGYRRLVERLGSSPPRSRRSPEEEVTHSLRTARLVDIAAHHGPWPANCLQRSLVLGRALRRQGIPSVIRLGVRRAPGANGYNFHAWVELGDKVLNDHPRIAHEFAPLRDEALPPDARLV